MLIVDLDFRRWIDFHLEAVFDTLILCMAALSLWKNLCHYHIKLDMAVLCHTGDQNSGGFRIFF